MADSSSDSDSAEKNHSIKELMRKPGIKSVTPEQIEQAFAKALFELGIGEHEIDVMALRIGTGLGDPDATMELKIYKKAYLRDGSPF